MREIEEAQNNGNLSAEQLQSLEERGRGLSGSKAFNFGGELKKLREKVYAHGFQAGKAREKSVFGIKFGTFS